MTDITALLSITSVTAEKIVSNGKVKGWRYTAHRAVDGTSDVVRKCATRLYANAFIYNARNNYAATPGTLAEHVTLGKNVPSEYRDTLILTVPVTVVE